MDAPASRPVSGSGAMFLPVFLLPLLAFALVWPLLRHGPSCGHDFGFHIQSWMDASAQLRRGVLLPQWAVSPAFNAGEPRFVFYPPLSWLLGSLLLMALPAAVVPAAFTFFALLGAATAMYALCRRFAPAAAAMAGAAVYTCNPYLLFTAYERTAYAELLAAAWMPLLFLAALRQRPTTVGVAVPLALLWLTNAPAAVMGTYALIGLASLRWLFGRRDASGFRLQVVPAGAGLLLGLGLAGFYLVPAALERRYVQIAMAIIPNMRVEDNFLFGHTGYGPHDAVLHTASVVALEVLGLAAVLLSAGFVLRRRARKAFTPDSASYAREPALLPVLALFTGLIGLLLWHGTLPVWHLVPELAFLQFPWRLLSVLGCVVGLVAALLLRSFAVPLRWAAAAALVLAVISSYAGIAAFREGCEASELPAARVARFASHHGVGPTDEYTPGNADNDQLRWDDPAFWLAETPNAPGPGTVPNPAATIPDYDQPPPLEQTVAGIAPHHLTLQVSKPEDLILNLRDYPAWQTTVNGRVIPSLERDDGLLALPLPAGQDTIDIRWRTLPEVEAGRVLSAVAVLAAAGLLWRSRRIKGLDHAL